jgi:cytochrome c-type biogenesis protein CcmH/NrfF
MKHKTLVSSFCTLALIVAVVLSARLESKDAPAADNPEVTKLLETIETQAADLQRDSDELESFTHSNLSWESHADELTRIKERINAIGKTIQQLENLRSSASPWQQEAIDRIVPLAQKLASNTQAAIEHLNANRQQLHDPQYQQYLKSNAEVARNLSALVRDFVEYGKTKTTMEALERKLEVPR